MASSFSLEVKGLDALVKKFDQLPVKIQEGMDRALQAGANEWANAAARDAPVYDAKLRGSITAEKVDKLWYRVVAGVFYAPYIEFGTKKKAKIPAGLEEIASQFKGGRGGSFKELLAAIEKWVKKNQIKTVSGVKSKAVKESNRTKARRKGSYSATAWWIALNIVKNGIKPHPFFFKNKQHAVNLISREIEAWQKK